MERYLSDKDIESSYSEYRIRELHMYSDISGYLDIEFPYNEDKVDNFIVYESGRIAFDYWYPESIYKELCDYIRMNA